MPSLGGAATGAATGAKIGSFIPGVGTAIGAGIGGLIGLFGGGKKKKKPAGPAGAADPTSPEGMLQARAKTLQGTATGALEEGLGAAGESLDYYTDILGADPSALLEATKPERGRVIDQYDTARQAIAEFGPRGGGTTSALAASRVQEASQLSDIMATGRREAAGAAADVGATIAGLGLSAEQIASSDLNTVLDALLTREGLDVQKRGQTMDAWAGVGEAAGSIFGPWIQSKLPGGGSKLGAGGGKG